MKIAFLLILAALVVSCNLPENTPATSVSPTEKVFTPTLIPTLAFTKVPVPPTSTLTAIPCDPHTVDYCITEGYFIFQRPIRPPGNDKVDLSYPYASTQNGRRDAHHGVEFQNEYGMAVHAAGDGKVAFAEADKTLRFSPWTNFYGNMVVIRHAGELFTLYAHLSKIQVKAGDEVRAGEVIGSVGQSGGATGPHLHFEVRRGADYTDYFSTENPELWLDPQPGCGAISITLKTRSEWNYEHPLVITRFASGSDDALFTHYLDSYSKGFEHNSEDAVLNNLPAGRYKIAFSDSSGLRERIVFVEAGKLTEVFFEVK